MGQDHVLFFILLVRFLYAGTNEQEPMKRKHPIKNYLYLFFFYPNMLKS